MACQITNNSNLDTSGFEDTIQQLVSFSQDRFGFEKPPALFLNSDPSNASDPLGKTAYYDPENKEIHIYVDERHPKDIMRSISHELIHHVQNLRGDLSGNHYHGEGYAQKDEHMREMEREAYEQGNLCFRDFEDKLKLDKTTYNEWRTNKMSLKEWKNNELFTLLSGKWGFGKNVVTEGKEITHMCALKVTHKETGQVGHPIKHTLTESGDISHYTVEFASVIVENIAVENLDIMVQEEHSHKRDDEKPHDEEKEVVKEEELEEAAKPDFLDLDGDGDKAEPMKDAAKDKKFKEGIDPQQVAKNLRKEIDALRAAGKTDEADKKQRELNAHAKYYQMSLEEGEIELQVNEPNAGATMADISEGGMKDLHSEIEDMLDDGKSVEDIVAALGVSKYDVDGVKQDMKTAKTELKEAMRKRFARLIK